MFYKVNSTVLKVEMGADGWKASFTVCINGTQWCRVYTGDTDILTMGDFNMRMTIR